MLESHVVAIHIPPVLRALTRGHESVLASGETLGEVLDSLDHVCPGIKARLVAADGRLSPDFALYLGGAAAGARGSLSTPVDMEESVSILPTR